MSNSKVAAYLKKMRERWPGLSKKQMAEDAGLSSNYIYRIEGGMTPGPDKLQALARKWSRTRDEYNEDCRQLWSLAGYGAVAVPAENVSERDAFTEEFLRIWDQLTVEEQRKLYKDAGDYLANRLTGKPPPEEE